MKPLSLALALLSMTALVPPGLALPDAPEPDPPLTNAMGVTEGDLLGLGPATHPAERIVPRAPGTVVRIGLTYGPYVTPPGHDLNKVLLDIPLHNGFLTQFRYRVVDAVTGEFPTNMQLHIHHALWFRVDPAEPGVFEFDKLQFGTGEERTDIDLDARSDAQPGGPRYGIWFAPDEAQNLVVMLHNKEPRARAAWLVLDATFVHGDAASIRAAQGCANLAPLPGDVGCAAGQDFHRGQGRLWGAVFDVPRGAGVYQYPPGFGTHVRYTMEQDGTIVAAWGHVHQEGRETVIVNLGSFAAPCGDLDGDGIPGITLVRSRKYDRNPLVWPHSEEVQMGGTLPGFRAPVRAGDRIAQFGFYNNDEHASYYQMTFAATHTDLDAPPAPRIGGCTLANTGPVLVDEPGGDATQSQLNRPWDGPELPLCGAAVGVACDEPQGALPPGLDATKVVIAGFSFLPGHDGMPGGLGAPARVKQGTSLQFHNADFAALVRHSVTSCPWPCNGPYRANYPLPDGTFDSRNLGNVDLFNGESVDASPDWSSPTSLAPGLYSYYCRLHPFMRGAFEVVS